MKNQDKELTIDEAIAILDEIADADFAEEHGITIEEIPAYIEKMRKSESE